ncbi:MAG: DUF4440 domain-containing protein [Flavobacteriales bacterium]|jgi:ketosteroid isomerase-like protein|nr:DUF4440 domain-containing protein [Flavobacteriales bacterium]NCG29701.1 DUF4440 domain-containing protein [Bacteroidota bacterium]MBT3964845.1 DUF4440 domain-containing protein [Flavobacteriales bacterium]MBT4704367.1 DUF4440 domain-containing protein [Flavobacteriales bacterium]MBT4930477.1 DUF4440 domain-containing protein [Flavobacteriales bacterium]
MYRYLFIIPLTFLSFCSAPVEQDVLEIRKVMEDQVEAWNDADVETFMQGYWDDDDMAFTSGKSITFGWQPALDRYLKSYPGKEGMGELAFSDLQIKRTSTSTAFTTGQWTLFRTADTLTGRFTLIWEKIDGDWLIIVDHSS